MVLSLADANSEAVSTQPPCPGLQRGTVPGPAASHCFSTPFCIPTPSVNRKALKLLPSPRSYLEKEEEKQLCLKTLKSEFLTKRVIHIKILKWSRTPWSLLTPPRPTSYSCLFSVENFSQRISLIREIRNAETKENSQKRLNNNNVVIKHSQGPLVLSQGL